MNNINLKLNSSTGSVWETNGPAPAWSQLALLCGSTPMTCPTIASSASAAADAVTASAFPGSCASSAPPTAAFLVYEFCYIITGGASSSTGGYAAFVHGTFSVNASQYSASGRAAYNIFDSTSTRTVINALGQTHVEQLRGVVLANGRVDDNLFVSSSPAVDGSGVQLPVATSGQTANGIGTMLSYDLQTAPFVFITNSALGLTSQLNPNVNVLYTSGQYTERLDAGGPSISPSASSFTLAPYNGALTINTCTAAPTAPLCVNYPQTPPAGSVLFNVTLNKAWTSLPSTYINDLLTGLTGIVSSSTPYASQSSYLGLYLMSCYPLRTLTAGNAPTLTFYVNAASVQSMGLTMSTVVSQVYSALLSTTALSSYLPANEQGLVTTVACPSTYNVIGIYAGLPCSGSVAASSAAPSTAAAASTAVVASTAAAATATSTSAAVITAAASTAAAVQSGGSSSSGLSGGAVAGIVIGGVVGLALACLLCIFLVMKGVTKGEKGSARFENEPSRTSAAPPADVELAETHSTVE